MNNFRDGDINKPWKDITGSESEDYRARRAGTFETSFIQQNLVLRTKRLWDSADWEFLESINKLGAWVFSDEHVVYKRKVGNVSIGVDLKKLMGSSDYKNDVMVKIIQLKIAEG